MALNISGIELDDLPPPTTPVDMGSQTIENVADPVNADDAATKQYVDDNTPSIANTTKLLQGDGAGNASASDITISSETYTLQRDGNTNNQFRVLNNSGGTSATTGIALGDGSSVGFSMVTLGSGYTPFGILSTGDTYLSPWSNLVIAVNSGNAIKFTTDSFSTEAARIDAGLMVGTTTDPGAGIINLNTGLRIGNAAASRKILVGNGTNYIASTETWAVPGTSGNVMTSDGTNWTSATPSTQYKVASGQSLTSSSLVDITGLTFSLVAGTYGFKAEIYGQVTSGTNGVQAGINYSGTYTSGDYNCSGNLSGTTFAQSVRGTANNTATGTFLTTATAEGVVRIVGQIVCGGSGTFSFRGLKVTSQTWTVRASSWGMVVKVA